MRGELFFLFLTACTCLPPTTMDAGLDANLDAGLAERCMGGCTFVIDRLNLETSTNVSVGRNFDGVHTQNGEITGCGKPDYTHPDGTMGIDNALAPLLDALRAWTAVRIDEGLHQSIISGSQLIVIDLSLVQDGEVRGRVAAGQSIGPPPLTPEHGLQPGIELQTSNQGALATGTVSGLKLRLQLEELTISMPLDEANAIPLRFRGVELTAQVTAEGLTLGEISGWLDIQELARVAEPLLPAFETPLLQILEGQADLEPDADGFCTRLSAAASFHAVPATLVAP